MPDGFSRKEIAKPPSRRDLDNADTELAALEIYTQPGLSFDDAVKAVMAEFGIKRGQANTLLHRAAERFYADRKSRAHLLWTKQSTTVERNIDRLQEAFDAGDMGKIGDILKSWERLSKLHGIDEKREDEQVVPKIEILNVIPGAVPDVVDGEVVQNELEAPDGSP